MRIEDHPVADYRGLLIDVGRQWHPVESLRPIIEMCRLYKINYLQLHLNDNTAGPVMAFPSTLLGGCCSRNMSVGRISTTRSTRLVTQS